MSLVGYWSLDASTISGTSVTDLSGAGNTGTMVATPTQGTGKLAEALTFNGTSQYVNVGTMGSFGSSMVTFSFATWVKTTATTAQFLCGAVNTGTTMLLTVTINGTSGQATRSGGLEMALRCATAAQQEYHSTNATSVNDGNWHHLAFTSDNAATPRQHFYLDGTDLALTADGTTNLPTFANWGFAMFIGSRNVRGTAAGFFAGSMDDVRFYNHVLSQSEVTTLATMTNPSIGQPMPVVMA
jgi:hypothetical protein